MRPRGADFLVHGGEGAADDVAEDDLKRVFDDGGEVFDDSDGDAAVVDAGGGEDPADEVFAGVAVAEVEFVAEEVDDAGGVVEFAGVFADGFGGEDGFLEAGEDFESLVEGVETGDVEGAGVHHVRFGGIGVEAVFDAVGEDGERDGGGGVEVAGELAFVAVEGGIDGFDFEIDAGDFLEEYGEVDFFFLSVFFDGEVGFVFGTDFGGVPNVVAEGVKKRQNE